MGAGLEVPGPLLALYFLHAFVDTFPMTAYGKWLFDVVHMPPAMTAVYYSVTFFPWNLKPLYGLISDNLPLCGYRRKPYIVLCELGTALSLVITGAFVRSVAGAFAIKLLDAVCEAFAQLMLGIFLVRLTTGDATSESSARVQSLANATKNAASVIAQFVGIPFYMDKSISAQQIISWSGVFPLISAGVCIFGLKETPIRHEKSSTREISNDEEIVRTKVATSFCQNLRDGWSEFKVDFSRKMKIIVPVLPAMLFFFLCSALPSDGMVWYQYMYSVLDDAPVCMQYINLSSMIGRFVSCLAYGRWCANRNVRKVFLLSTVSSVLAGLPRLLLAPPMASLPVSACTFLTTESFLTAFTSEFALLQLLVVATYYCPESPEVQGLTYALYLSFMDFGGVVSGLLSSLVVTALDIVPDPVTAIIDWQNLWALVVISAAGQLLVLVFLCVLPEKVNTQSVPQRTRPRRLSASLVDGTEKLPLLAHVDGVAQQSFVDVRV